MQSRIPEFLLKNDADATRPASHSRHKFSFLGRTLNIVSGRLRQIYLQAETSEAVSVLHQLNPVTRVISFIYLIIIISLINNIASHLLICMFIFSLYIYSGVKMLRHFKKAVILAFFFGFLVFIPAALNVITPGDMILKIFDLKAPHHFWIYDIPRNIGFTIQGCRIVSILFLRVLNSVSLSLILVYGTSFPELLKSFRSIFVPNTVLMVVSLAYKYIFILCKTVEETNSALRSRLIGNVRNKAIRDILAGRILFIYKRSQVNYEQTYYAMISRGYAGKIVMHNEKHLQAKDILVIAYVIIVGLFFISI